SPPIERDLSFRGEKRLSAYVRDARLAGRIVV
ncbi:transposase, partial [Pseudomonas aeruginosa]